MSPNTLTAPAVLGLFPNLQPERLGGVEVSGRLAWQAIRAHTPARGERPVLFCYEPGADAASDAGLERIAARSQTRAIWQLLRLRVKPRLILVWHLHLLRLVPLLRAPQARVALFLHGIEAWRPQGALTRRVLARVNLVLSNSTFTYERFVSTLPQAKNIAHRVTPLGLGTPVTYTNPPVAPAMLMLGRLDSREDYKGHREMIGAWTQVREHIPDAQLWIAGSGTLRADLEIKANELGLNRAVRFYGQVTESQKEELLNQARALALPSRREGFGLVCVEAMRVGRPCLISDYDAAREVVNPPEAGLAVNPNDSQALAEAACRLLTLNQEWLYWSKQARERYEANFTAVQFQQRLLAGLEPLQ